MARRVVIGAVLATLVAVAGASAAEQPTGIAFNYADDLDGTGLLVGFPVPDGSWGTVTWQACPPGAACTQVQPDPKDLFVHVGPAVAGTTFVATASDGEQALSATSDPYGGPLKTVMQPTVTGQLRVGHLIRPVAAMWSGGWGGEQPYLQLQACRTRRGGCQVISSTYWVKDCFTDRARIPRRYLGWYVRVADNRSARNPVIPAFLARRPRDLTPLTTSGNTAVATVGRIGPGHGPAGAC